MLRVVASLAFGLGAVLLAGCGDKPAPTPPAKDNKGGHDHGDHTKGEKDVTLPGGKLSHAILSAHIDAAGSAIEISFESAEKEPKPVTLPEKAKITARVQDGETVHDLVFKPGPKDERKTDPEGQCSRFEADAPWMRPSAKLTVTVTIEGVDQKIPWVDWVPNDHVHKH